MSFHKALSLLQTFDKKKYGILCEIIVPIIMVIIGLSIMTISFLKDGALIGLFNPG